MERLTFKQLTRNLLKDRFGLVLLQKHKVLADWFELSKQQTVDDFEEKTIVKLQKGLLRRCQSWNEFELSEWFIGPLLTQLDFDTDDCNLFAFHDLTAEVDGYELTGRPDVMYARGLDEAQSPYFFFHEYKRQTDPDGNPQTQLLGAMLAAQALNNNDIPIYGMYVIGTFWYFVILKDKEYCVSKSLVADDEEIFDIFKLLKALKEIVSNY